MENETQTHEVYHKVYIPKWGLTQAVIPCFYSHCPHNATIVEDGKVSGKGVCLLGLHTGKYEDMTNCSKRWDRKEYVDFLETYFKTRPLPEETRRG